MTIMTIMIIMMTTTVSRGGPPHGTISPVSPAVKPADVTPISIPKASYIDEQQILLLFQRKPALTGWAFVLFKTIETPQSVDSIVFSEGLCYNSGETQ